MSGLEPRSDEEDDEVALDLRGPATLPDISHGCLPLNRRVCSAAVSRAITDSCDASGGQPRDVVDQQGVTDEGPDVEQRVCRHQGRDPTPTPVQPAEEQAHREVADETADALVEVIAAAQQGAEPDRGRVSEADLSQSDQDVAEDDELLE